MVAAIAAEVAADPEPEKKTEDPADPEEKEKTPLTKLRSKK